MVDTNWNLQHGFAIQSVIDMHVLSTVSRGSDISDLTLMYSCTCGGWTGQTKLAHREHVARLVTQNLRWRDGTD